MMSPHDAVPTDEEIVTLVLAGRLDAFHILFERHHAALTHYLTRLTGNSDLAADLAQDTFLEAYRCRGSLANRRAFAPWLYRIAQHRLQRLWRRRRILQFLSLENVPALIRDRPASGELENSYEERELIQQVLRGLTSRQRSALLLHDLGGLSTQEVATVLGCSTVAAERQISRTRATFRARYSALADRLS